MGTICRGLDWHMVSEVPTQPTAELDLPNNLISNLSILNTIFVFFA